MKYYDLRLGVGDNAGARTCQTTICAAGARGLVSSAGTSARMIGSRVYART